MARQESGPADRPNGKLLGLWTPEELRYELHRAMYKPVYGRGALQRSLAAQEPRRLVALFDVWARPGRLSALT
jgi:hypothetical protein